MDQETFNILFDISLAQTCIILTFLFLRNKIVATLIAITIALCFSYIISHNIKNEKIHKNNHHLILKNKNNKTIKN